MPQQRKIPERVSIPRNRNLGGKKRRAVWAVVTSAYLGGLICRPFNLFSRNSLRCRRERRPCEHHTSANALAQRQLPGGTGMGECHLTEYMAFSASRALACLMASTSSLSFLSILSNKNHVKRIKTHENADSVIPLAAELCYRTLTNLNFKRKYPSMTLNYLTKSPSAIPYEVAILFTSKTCSWFSSSTSTSTSGQQMNAEALK